MLHNINRQTLHRVADLSEDVHAFRIQIVDTKTLGQGFIVADHRVNDHHTDFHGSKDCFCFIQCGGRCDRQSGSCPGFIDGIDRIIKGRIADNQGYLSLQRFKKGCNLRDIVRHRYLKFDGVRLNIRGAVIGLPGKFVELMHDKLCAAGRNLLCIRMAWFAEKENRSQLWVKAQMAAKGLLDVLSTFAEISFSDPEQMHAVKMAENNNCSGQHPTADSGRKRRGIICMITRPADSI